MDRARDDEDVQNFLDDLTDANKNPEARAFPEAVDAGASLPVFLKVDPALVDPAKTYSLETPDRAKTHLRGSGPAFEIKQCTLTKLLKDKGYLRREYAAPLLDGYIEITAAGLRDDSPGKSHIDIGWRVAINRLESSSFEGEGFSRARKMSELTDVTRINDNWFAATDDQNIVSFRQDVPGPTEIDYEGQTDRYGHKGKFGNTVLQIKVP